MTDLTDILRAIPTLDATAHAKIIAACKVQKQFTHSESATKAAPDTSSTLSDDATWLLETITKHMQTKGLDLTGFKQASNSPGIKAFEEKAPDVCKFIRRNAKGNKNHQRAMLRLGVELLQQNLVQLPGFSANTRAMMAHSHRIVGLINNAFPGYAENGLLHLVMKPTKKNGK